MKRKIVRDVHGVVFKNVDTAPTMRQSIILVQVTKDNHGTTLSLADKDMMIEIPLEEVQYIIKLTGEIAQ